MDIQGFIKSIGTPREWTSREGQAMKSAPLHLSIPRLDAQGREVSDDILGDVTYGNDDYLKRLQESVEQQKRVSCDVRFSLREYNDKLFQNCRIVNITVLL